MKNYKEKEIGLKEITSDNAPSGKEKEEAFLGMIRGEYKEEFKKLFNREFGRRFKEMKETEEELSSVKEAIKPLCELYKEEDISLVVKQILGEKEGAPLSEEERKIRYSAWMNEAEETKGKYPGFDLAKELDNPEFRAGLMSGIPMENLYRGIHFDELAKFISEAAAKATVENIRAGHGRINEVGSETSPSVMAKKDVGSLTDSEIEEFLKKIRRGEKISF